MKDKITNTSEEYRKTFVMELVKSSLGDVLHIAIKEYFPEFFEWYEKMLVLL